MNIRQFLYGLTAGILTLFAAGCAGNNVSSIPTEIPEITVVVNTPTAETSTEAAPADTSIAVTGACGNPYMPIVAGATWNYKLTGPVSDTFTHTILSVEDASFTEQDQFGTGVIRQGKWQCDNGNLIALNPSAGGSASISTEGISVDFQTKDLSGITVPAEINPGDTWAQSLTLEGTQTVNNLSFPASNQFSSTCKAIGVESVTVEAGTFDAMRVECENNMDITISLAENTPSNTVLTFTNIVWYAQNVGMVKTSTSGMGLDSTVELTSYNIPS